MPTTAMMIESLIQMRHDPGGVPVDQFWALVERFRADLVNQALAVLGNQNDAEGAAPGDPRIQATGDYLVKRLPQWPANNAGNTCFYYMYYGTLTMFQIGGAQWKDWNEALKNALLPSQCKGGDDDGSWDPKADWLCEWGGRVYTTAMGALCLEVYYRYLPAYR